MLKDIFQVFPWLTEKESQVIYQCIGDDFMEGVVSCGFMRKNGVEDSQYHFMLHYYSCFVLLSGSGVYYDKMGKEYAIKPGCLVQRFPGEEHTTIVREGEPWLEFFINFGTKTYEYMKSMNMIPGEVPVRPIMLTPDLMKECIAIVDGMKESTNDDAPFFLLKLQRMVYLLQNSVVYSQPIEIDQAMEQACFMLGRDLKEEILMEHVADTVAIGYETFRKLFKQIYGVSPMQYRMNARMRQAKMMLLSGVTVKQTADMVGYSDYFAFAKQFKRVVGASPAAFRKHIGIQNR